jgi:hypothetical protein
MPETTFKRGTFTEEEEKELAERRGKAISDFKTFIKENKEEIEKLKKEFPQATKAGIKDLIFLLWLLDITRAEEKKTIFSKARNLLRTLFVSGWISVLSSFKLAGDVLKK